MREAKGNMLLMKCDALVITTNGFVKRDGAAVMGRGIALQVSKTLPWTSCSTPKAMCLTCWATMRTSHW